MDRLQELKGLDPADLQRIITQKDEDGRCLFVCSVLVSMLFTIAVITGQ